MLLGLKRLIDRLDIYLTRRKMMRLAHRLEARGLGRMLNGKA